MNMLAYLLFRPVLWLSGIVALYYRVPVSELMHESHFRRFFESGYGDAGLMINSWIGGFEAACELAPADWLGPDWLVIYPDAWAAGYAFAGRFGWVSGLGGVRK